MITYTITVCDELQIIKKSLEIITGSLSADENLLIQYDIKNGTLEVKEFLDNQNINYLTYSFDGDYGKMKNNLLENVTTSWIFHLDGDEYIFKEDIEVNRKLINEFDKSIDAFFIERNNVNTDTDENMGLDLFVRLFKNRKWIKWEEKIHEYIIGYDLYEYITDYKIQHERSNQEISASINL